MHAALGVYWGLANFRRSARYRMLTPDEIRAYARDSDQDGLLAAGLYHDAQVDDARLVVETVKSARRLGGEAANHAEVVEFLRDADGASLWRTRTRHRGRLERSGFVPPPS